MHALPQHLLDLSHPAVEADTEMGTREGDRLEGVFALGAVVATPISLAPELESRVYLGSRLWSEDIETFV